MKNQQEVNRETETQKHKTMVKIEAYYMKERKNSKQKTQTRVFG